MQLLSDASNLRSSAVVGHDAASPGECAWAMLEGLPPVMWFMRRHLRCRRTHRLSVPQFRTLLLVDRLPATGLSAVAENLGASAPTASRLVTGLVSKGMLVRKASTTDRRQCALLLTAKGRSAMNAARDETRDRIAEEIAHLQPDQRAHIIEAMGVLQAVFDPSAARAGSGGASSKSDLSQLRQ